MCEVVGDSRVNQQEACDTYFRNKEKKSDGCDMNCARYNMKCVRAWTASYNNAFRGERGYYFLPLYANNLI